MDIKKEQKLSNTCVDNKWWILMAHYWASFTAAIFTSNVTNQKFVLKDVFSLAKNVGVDKQN